MSIALKKAHKEGKRIYKYKNNPHAIKGPKTYSSCYIIKNGVIKQTTINQLPQYRKYGWEKLVRRDGNDPSREGLSTPTAYKTVLLT